MVNDCILIIDFGSQLTQLIARRVRESNVYSEIVPFNRADEVLAERKWNGIILSGGPASVLEQGTPRIPSMVFKSQLPLLGICYGQQAMVAGLGGEVEQTIKREFGRAFLDISGTCTLFQGVWKEGDQAQVWMSHGDIVTSIPKNFRVVGTSAGAPFAAIADDNQRYYGLQFHPEVVHTIDGAALIKNFTYNVAGCSGDWSMTTFREQQISDLRSKIGTGRVICGLSGGVDSAVVAALLHEAVGDQLTCIFVDNGLLRAGEAELVVDLFQKNYKIRLVHVDAKSRFLDCLKQIEDPEDKRKNIGFEFVKVFEEEAKKIGGVDYLAQGTLYPDVIESISPFGGPSVTIKSHHNVGGLPEKMNLKLIEPLRELFKDEVRMLGKELGLPEEFIGRHPFPGPGLAIRVPGEVSSEKLEILRKADSVFIEEIRSQGIYDEIWQAFVVLLPVRTVGVMGDDRSYEYVCSLRAVTSTDGMTADVYPFTQDFLNKTANRIVNEVRGINRVVYDITSKPPGTIEWE